MCDHLTLIPVESDLGTVAQLCVDCDEALSPDFTHEWIIAAPHALITCSECRFPDSRMLVLNSTGGTICPGCVVRHQGWAVQKEGQ